MKASTSGTCPTSAVEIREGQESERNTTTNTALAACHLLAAVHYEHTSAHPAHVITDGVPQRAVLAQQLGAGGLIVTRGYGVTHIAALMRRDLQHCNEASDESQTVSTSFPRQNVCPYSRPLQLLYGLNDSVKVYI